MARTHFTQSSKGKKRLSGHHGNIPTFPTTTRAYMGRGKAPQVQGQPRLCSMHTARKDRKWTESTGVGSFIFYQKPAKLQAVALFPAEQGSLGMFFELTTEEPDVILAGFESTCCMTGQARQLKQFSVQLPEK